MNRYRNQTRPEQDVCLSSSNRPGSRNAHPQFITNYKSRKMRGFSLLELLVVISIIAIFLSIAVPTYSRSIVAARERVLRSDLELLRSSIWKYTLDKQKAPQGIDDLKSAGYIEKVPVDPMTHESNWEVVQEEVMLSFDQQDPGITDVHSASNAVGSDGTAYSTW